MGGVKVQDTITSEHSREVSVVHNLLEELKIDPIDLGEVIGKDVFIVDKYEVGSSSDSDTESSDASGVIGGINSSKMGSTHAPGICTICWSHLNCTWCIVIEKEEEEDSPEEEKIVLMEKEDKVIVENMTEKMFWWKI